MRRAQIAAALATSILCAAPRASAADDHRALAQTLFDEGVHLMEQARCDDAVVTPDRRPTCREALDRFRRAHALYPEGLGALRNMAFVERGLGKSASALRDFREVARRAPLDPNPSKQLWAKHATEEADALEKIVPRVRIVAHAPPQGTRVVLDGGAIPEAALGVALPVDPGDHVVEATAPGFVTFRRTFALEPREERTIDVTLAPSPPPELAAPVAERSWIPPVLIGAGAVAIGVGVGLGLAARSARDDACDVGTTPLRCHDASGLDRARTFANAATILSVGGAALAAAGVVVLVLERPKARDVGLRIAPTFGVGAAGVAAALDL